MKDKKDIFRTWLISVIGMIWLLVSQPFIASAQDLHGIRFERGLNWREILSKAKTKQKLILVDCFATWCGPCKQMDQRIFSNDTIGRFVNDHFVSIKVQMDSTVRDGEDIRNWYLDAHKMKEEAHVTAFPTFLFYSDDGKLIHKGIGFQETKDFIRTLKDATDTSKQYFTLLNKYRSGGVRLSALPRLAAMAKDLDDRYDYNAIITNYRLQYIDTLSNDDLRSKRILHQVDAFPELIYDAGSKGRFFRLFYERPDLVDSQMKNVFKGYAEFFVNNVITAEEINPKLYINGKPIRHRPSWRKIQATIKTKYPKVDANLLLLNAQILYYRITKNGPLLVRYFVKKTDKYGLDTAGLAGFSAGNTIADIMLKYCDDKKTLIKATGWLVGHLRRYSEFSDTTGNNDLTIYAGMLYKSGKKEKGLQWMRKEVEMLKKQAALAKRDLTNDPNFNGKTKILERMKRDEKIDSTWDINAFH